eukprot:6183219-Pleurochrysis_carterae.AAC.2
MAAQAARLHSPEPPRGAPPNPPLGSWRPMKPPPPPPAASPMCRVAAGRRRRPRAVPPGRGLRLERG